MKMFDTKWAKWVGGAIGGIVAGVILMVGATKVVYPAISEMVGLSVAQSSTVWNSVADAAKGDSLGSGVLAHSPYLYNGLSFDRVRGDITNGMDVDVTRISGSITPADAYANPTTANQMWSLTGLFNGTTWDRWKANVSPVQGINLFNSQTTSAANTAVSVTLTAVAAQRIHIYEVEGRCNTAASTSGLTITDGGTTIWSTTATEVLAANNFIRTWPTGLTAATNSQVVVTLAACGAAVTGTLIVQADKF